MPNDFRVILIFSIVKILINFRIKINVEIEKSTSKKSKIHMYSKNWLTNFRFEKNQWDFSKKIKFYSLFLLVKIINVDFGVLILDFWDLHTQYSWINFILLIVSLKLDLMKSCMPVFSIEL